LASFGYFALTHAPPSPKLLAFMSEMNNKQVVVQVGTDGGNITLYGAKNGNGWNFSMDIYDCSALALDDEEAMEPTRHIRLVNTWTDAVALLDHYRWATLYPLAVHPEFRGQIWNEVQRRCLSDGDRDGRYDLQRWRQLCHAELNWIDSYYEGIEFFNQEPQHIGRKQYADATFNTFDKVQEHLRCMEVTLNHNLKQFFLLAPNGFRNDFCEELFGTPFSVRFKMHGPQVDKDFALENCVQPDFLFTSDEHVVCVEMKVGAKSSIDQVLKYALLGLAVEGGQEKQKAHYLVLLGSGTIAKQFPQHFDTTSKVMDAVRGQDMAEFLRNKPVHLRNQQERFEQIVSQMRLEFVNYEGFARFLLNAAPSLDDETPGAEVFRNLIFGVVSELKRRHLA
jgi:hypothetical protein